MNNRLDCDIVRDLLPSYAEGLASPTTTAAVQAHLADCPDCAAALQRMQEPEPQPTAEAEVDYLKKVRRRSNRKSLLIAIVLMLIGMSLIGFRQFYVGSKADATAVACRIAVENDTVTVSGTLTGSMQGVSRVTFSESAGIVSFQVHVAPIALFNSGDFSATYTASGPIGQVRMGDWILWQDGVEIDRRTAQLFAASNAYVGDMPANSEIASLLGVGEQFGPYTNALQTDAAPYGWTLRLETPIAQTDEQAARQTMAADAYAMLALIGNLDAVTWQYDTAVGVQQYTVTAADASAFAGHDIKDCANAVTLLQQLLQKLRFQWSGVSPLQAADAFALCVHNRCDDEIYGIGLHYYLDGALVGSRGFANADHGPLTRGGETLFSFSADDFPVGFTAAQQVTFDLSVLDQSGGETVVCTGVPLSVTETTCFALSGDAQSGFSLQED